MASPAADAAVERLAESLWELWRVWRRRSHPVRRHAVSSEQYFLLRRLQRLGPQTVSALAQETGVTAATVTVTTQRLEEAGLVTRERQQQDQRVVAVSLTALGRERLAGWQAERLDALVSLLAVLTPEERAGFGRAMERMLEEARP